MIEISTGFSTQGNLFQGFIILSRPGRISLLSHSHLQWQSVGLEISLCSSLSTSSFLLNWSSLYLSSGLFMTQFAPSLAHRLPKQSPPGALPTAQQHSEGMPHKQSKAVGHPGGEKHLPLIKMWRFALSRRAGPRPDRQIFWIQSTPMALTPADPLLPRAPHRNTTL